MIGLMVAAALAAAEPLPTASGVTLYPPEFFADAQPATAMEMISRLPGFGFENSDSAIRGFGAAAGNVLIDGERPASKSETLQDALRRIPASRVERIELIRGGAPGVDMQGKTVLANVVRKTGAATTGMVQVSNIFILNGGHQPGWRLEGTRKWGDRQLEASLVYGGSTEDQAGEGPRLRLDPSGATLIASRYHVEGALRHLTGAVAYQQGLGGGDIRADVRLQRSKNLNDEENRLTFPVGAEFNRNANHTDHGEVGLRYSRAFGRLATESVLLQQLRRQDNDGVLLNTAGRTLFGNRRTNGETVGRFVGIYRVSDAFSVQGGAEAAWNWLDSTSRYSLNGAAIALPAGDVEVEERRGEAFVLGAWQASPKLSLEAGLRVEASQIISKGDVTLEKTLRFLKPRVAVVWSPRAAHQFRFRVEQEVGQLNFDDFVASSSLGIGMVVAGNPDLDPQRALVAEAVYERRFWQKGALVVTFKHSWLSDAIDRAPVFGPSGVFDAPGNIGDGRRDDLNVTVTLPLDRLGVGGGLLKMRVNRRWTALTDPTTGEIRAVTNVRPFEWGFNFSQDLPRWHATWGVDMNSRWWQAAFRYNEVEKRRAGAAVFIYAEVRPRPDLSVRAEIMQANDRTTERLRLVYGAAGRRGPLAFTDRRSLNFVQMLNVRIRKSFG